MRRLVIAVLAAGTVLTSLPAAHAAPQAEGILCGIGAAQDPQVEGSVTGELSGGPIALVDDSDPTVAYSGSLTCTVQVNASTHAGADACAVTGPGTTGTVAAAGTCTFAADADDNVYVCTEVNIAGGPTLYHADSNDPLVEGGWSTDPNSSCALTTSANVGPTYEELLATWLAILCPVLMSLPDGGASAWYMGCPGATPPPPPPPPRAKGHITIHRFPTTAGPQAGARLYAAPVAQNGSPWSCTDVHTGLPVVQGGLLTMPHPGVSCTPPAGFTAACTRVDAGGYHADAGNGTVRITSACTGLSVSAEVQIPSNWPEYRQSAPGNGTLPWSCTISENLSVPDLVDYWTFCDVNLT